MATRTYRSPERGHYPQLGPGQAALPQQLPNADVGNPWKELWASLAGLNPDRIPTGVLLNRTVQLSNPHRYAGLGDTVASYSTFEQQYWQFFHSALDTTQLTSLASLRQRVAQRTQQGGLPLLMLSYSYNELTGTAARDNLITIDSVNGRVFDGPDMSRSPYTSGQFFSVALPTPTATGTFSLYVGPEFWLGNTAAPSSVLLDFGDGWGARTVAMGSTIQVQIPTDTPVNTTPQRVRTNTGIFPADPITPIQIPAPTLASGSPLQVTNPTTSASAAGSFIWGPPNIPSLLPDLALGLVAQRAWPGYVSNHGVHFLDNTGTRATAIAWIKYAAGNTSGKLRRPLVFVEGIDFDSYRNGHHFAGNQPIAQTGPIPLSQFTTYPLSAGGFRNGAAGWNEVTDYNKDYPSLEKFPDLRAQLQASQALPDGSQAPGYDIIYLDFSDGASLIQDNAMVLVELLQWINQSTNRTPDAEETMVIGASMGGQVSRFALAWMEQQGLCHNSKLWISFDSPHRGANISLGIQHMFDRLQGIWIGSSSAEDVVQNKLLREATEQMVLFHFSQDATTLRQQWQSWQTSAGSYPSLLRKVAIANGSGQAVPQAGMYPGILLLSTSQAVSTFLTGPNFAYALPGTSSLGHDNVVFRYHKPYTLHDNYRYTYCDPTWSYFDQAPGSFRSTSTDAEQQSDGDLVSEFPSQTFMATISALDIQDAGGFNRPNLAYNVQQEIPLSNLPNRAKYAFDAYFAAGGTNEPHIQLTNGQPSTQGNPSYTTDNSTWIQNELRESAHRMPATLTGPYNYGSPYRHLLPSVQVNSGGRLYLNNPALPASGGTTATQTSPTAGLFEVYTSNCATVVQVNNGGQVLVGNTSTYPARLGMAANSLLDLRAGSRLDIGPGSMLRIAAGATLVLRAGTTLNLNGLLVVDAGGYVCIENPASLVTGPTGQLSLSPQANFFANPALNLTGLACQACLTQGYLTLNDGSTPAATCAPTSAVFSISASQGTQGPYTWQVSQGTIDSGQGTSQITVSGLPFQAYTLQVQVSAPASCAGAADLTQQLSQSYYTRSPDGSFCTNDGADFAALYPNPATDAVEVHLTAATTTSAATAPLTARLFDAYGQPRAEQTSHGEAVLRLSTRQLPAGLYFVHLVRKGTVIGRQQLRIER
ncbi:T9SS type A sorting domain-containing protein [Hymenobacter baengnokdamensis]|uniref:T9SS type A sorting domain-containing protein n=1 Tax=Hymenobacter baengnokdamensis TaxID=2615203 RepID=UPI0012468518|nr:T9SS type A sorting domain-containing protein [Hymenobacter baengnokdamensis]